MYTQDFLFVKSDKIADVCLPFLEKGKPYKAIRFNRNLYHLYDPETDEQILDDYGHPISALIDQDYGCAYLNGSQWELVEPQDI